MEMSTNKPSIYTVILKYLPGLLYKTDAGVRGPNFQSKEHSVWQKNHQNKGFSSKKWDFTHKRRPFGDKIPKQNVGFFFTNLDGNLWKIWILFKQNCYVF